MNEPDRRTAVRRPLHVPVRMRSDGLLFNTKAADISASGICLIGDQQFPVGSVWDLEFRLPTAGGPVAVKARARVIHSVLGGKQGWKSGLLFTALSRDDAGAVASFIQRS